jgi:ABC-type Mn2+/Zn2+ transport system ATPase subunit
VDALSVHFGDRSALEEIRTSFSASEIVALLGPNGAGKSTLLRVIAGLLPATHGRVLLGGSEIEGASNAVVYVPQRSAVDWTFPVSVLDVVLMARAKRISRLRGYDKSDRIEALGSLTQVGMERFADVQIGQLSGGQQQRVFLARALLQQGEIYLLDEPFTGIDVPTQELIVSLLGTLRSAGRTILYATHDLAQAAKSSDRVLLINRTLLADGPPRTVMTAAHLHAAFGGQAIIPFSDEAAEAEPA